MPQELQIGLAVSEGRTNREVAEVLFLSPKSTMAATAPRGPAELDERTRIAAAPGVRDAWSVPEARLLTDSSRTRVTTWPVADRRERRCDAGLLVQAWCGTAEPGARWVAGLSHAGDHRGTVRAAARRRPALASHMRSDRLWMRARAARPEVCREACALPERRIELGDRLRHASVLDEASASHHRDELDPP